MTEQSRREFVGRVARRAAYVAPMVLALSSRRAYAGVSGCGQDGSVCFTNQDCCQGWQCKDAMGMSVMMGDAGTCQ